MALGNELGQFDYIIAHGVYSWVPDAVRQRILQLCRNHLSPHGIAYISYNTLPGWKMRGTLRDMLLHHTRNGKSPRERLALAYQLFELLEQALAHDEALSSPAVLKGPAVLGCELVDADRRPETLFNIQVQNVE